MADTQREREDKFDVDTGFVVPDLSRFTPRGGTVENRTIRLRSTYWDTEDHALLGQRMTLRRRDGDADTGWHLKLPDGAARTEVRLALDDGTGVPDELAALVAGVVGTCELRPVAVLDTERTLQVHLDPGGTAVLEVADDVVHATVPGELAVAAQWREVEVELGSGGEKLLARVGRRLVASGARRSASPSKLARALHLPVDGGAAPAALPAAEVLVRYVAEQYHELGAGDVALRRGLDPVHPTRVATRRLRSTLRVFAELFDPAAATDLDQELAWYAGLLGEVRDRQVQRARFATSIAALPPELVLGPVAARIDEELLTEQLQHRATLMTALDSGRYRLLLATVGA